MQHISYSPVDAQFRCLERDLPADAPFNRTDPIPGIAFGFALESRYPLPAGEPAIYYGTVTGEVTDDPSILLRKITVEEYDAAYAAEMKAREKRDRPPPSEPITVDAERDRRISAGIVFADHFFQTAALDRERIDRSRISAMAAIMGGAQRGDMRWHGLPVDFFWIAADNSRVPMDAQTMVDFGNTVAAREGLLIVAGNDLKGRIAGGEEIADITEDALWPA